MWYTVEYTLLLKRKILPHETWINQEDIILNKISPQETSKTSKFIEVGRMVVAAELKEGEMESCYSKHQISASEDEWTLESCYLTSCPW